MSLRVLQASVFDGIDRHAFLEALARQELPGRRASLTVLRDLDLEVDGRRDGRDRRRVRRGEEHAAARPRRPRIASIEAASPIDGAELTAMRDAERRRLPQSARRLRLPVPSSAAGVSARSRTPRCRCASRGMPMAEARPRAASAAASASAWASASTHRPGMLSGGEQQRVGRRACAGDAAVDPAGRRADRATSTSRPPTRCTRCSARCIGRMG